MSSSTPISAARAARLILRLRLARLFNQMASGFRRFRRVPVSGKRTATPGKNKLGWFVGGLVALSMIFSFTNIARQAMANMQERLGSMTVTATSSLDPGPPQGWLGAQLANLTKPEAQALGRAEARGAKVTGTVAASPAAKAGLARDDIIIGLDRHDIASAGDLIRKVASKAPGASVELILLRNGEERRVRVQLAARPTGAASPQHQRLRLPAAPGYVLPWKVLQGSALEVCVLVVATLLMSLASREIAQPDWDVEWLVTLPVPLTTLFGVRILERTLLNPTGLFILWPFLSVVAWEAGHRFAAPLLGLAATLALLGILTTVWTVCDTGLRLNLSPPKLRNLQALLSIVSVGFLYLAMSPGIAADSYLLGWAPGVPPILFWLPPGLAVGALAAATPTEAGLALLSLTIEAFFCVALGFAILAYQVRSGVVSVAGRESGRGTSKKLQPPRATTRRLPLSPIQARELKLLARDRS
ncbi:MAG: PDZ domain-containing protein, partial [Hyphomicrobiaceae bacterium]|nr:PDZ domain-containing protein [Hyphomicrobiaceae bacterium]